MKLVERIAQKHDQIARVRSDHLHKLTHRLIHEASTICTEPHNITGLVSAGVAKRCEALYRKGLRRKDIRRAMLDIGWGELRRQIGYKAPWKGRQYMTMPEGSATDQACWRCGRENKMPEHTSEYSCEGCHWHGTRQENTALACLGYVDPATVPPKELWDEQAAE
jgi:putative transposase